MIRKVKRSTNRNTGSLPANGDMHQGSDPGVIPAVPVKSNRFLKTTQGWYIRTRECNDLGPFASEEDAVQALKDYLDEAARKGTARQFQPTQLYGIQIHDPDACSKDHCALCVEVEHWQSREQKG
ncbi:hypothetical protein FWJ25_03685 [Marinobacter salinexigens]|uniref:DUF6316 domain-containing protein n=1 Tax=Marinobacter salinexigens TaxID=2919747 RepID=A0A5B0VPW9_9GAMM|nr:DUF6316 family protein [Marinobacter salinexigens]KAA1176245.1 hypothetical protein FWJ25_03685 [Marinobacter salinexigens]